MAQSAIYPDTVEEAFAKPKAQTLPELEPQLEDGGLHSGFIADDQHRRLSSGSAFVMELGLDRLQTWATD
jgi:hypothetical protein